MMVLSDKDRACLEVSLYMYLSVSRATFTCIHL